MIHGHHMPGDTETPARQAGHPPPPPPCIVDQLLLSTLKEKTSKPKPFNPPPSLGNPSCSSKTWENTREKGGQGTFRSGVGGGGVFDP